jgi:hypothetical protein
MRLAIGWLPGGFGSRYAASEEQRSQCQSSKAHAGIGQKRAARNSRAAISAMRSHRASSAYIDAQLPRIISVPRKISRCEAGQRSADILVRRKSDHLDPDWLSPAHADKNVRAPGCAVVVRIVLLSGRHDDTLGTFPARRCGQGFIGLGDGKAVGDHRLEWKLLSIAAQEFDR